MFRRTIVISALLLTAGCAGMVLAPVSEDLKKRAATAEFPEFMKEYAASGFYLRQRLDPTTWGWVTTPRAGQAVGVNLVAIDYGPRGYDYRQFDEVVQNGLFEAMSVYCSARTGRMFSRGQLPLGDIDYFFEANSGRLCVGADGKLVGAILYGRVSRDPVTIRTAKVGSAVWRSLEYNVYGASQLAEFSTQSKLRHKEERKAQQQQVAARKQYQDALAANRQKMDTISASNHQSAFNGWRQGLKEGETCWVGPRTYNKKLMLHGMVIERKGSIVRVQFDGNTNAGFQIDTGKSEEWVQLKEVYPDREFDVLTRDGSFEPRVLLR